MPVSAQTVFTPEYTPHIIVTQTFLFHGLTNKVQSSNLCRQYLCDGVMTSKLSRYNWDYSKAYSSEYQSLSEDTFIVGTKVHSQACLTHAVYPWKFPHRPHVCTPTGKYFHLNFIQTSVLLCFIVCTACSSCQDIVIECCFCFPEKSLYVF